LKGFKMCKAFVLKIAAIVIIIMLVLAAFTTLNSSAAAPELQVTPEQQVEPTLIVPETGPEDLIFGGWVIWAILIVFGLVLLIALIMRSGSPGRNP
jgi:uncharacterized membrane protein